MSDMLARAIVDAEALKEAAVRNAENLVLEKYSNQIKEAVGSLLEQEDPMAMAPPPVEDTDGGTPPKVMEHIPLAVTSENLDEEIEIPLEQLMEQIAEFSRDSKFGKDFVDSEILEEGTLDIVEEDLEEMLFDDDTKTKVTPQEGRGKIPELEESDSSDSIVLDEEDFASALEEAIQEALIVDLPGSNKSGWAGTPASMVTLAEEEILALEQDSERREHNEAVRKAVRKLENVNESLTKQNTQFRIALQESKKQMTKFGHAVVSLKEKLDQINLTNARLLYQNKALESTSLNERQKRKLVEAVSNAETVEEAKVIFETLESTVGSTSRKTQPKSLSEAVEKSSSMILSSRKREETTKQKDHPTYDRWKSLAGLL